MYRVDEAICTGCGGCVDACPVGTIALVDRRARIDDAACIDCGSCARACPQGAILMVDACPVIQPYASLTAVAPVKASAEDAPLVHRPGVEVLPAEPRPSRFWPMVSGAFVWAARELLPEVFSAWRKSRAGQLGAVQSVSRNSVTFGRAASRRPRSGHRHRWGRA